VQAACLPYQYALRTRSGTECVGHMFRAATDLDPNLTIVSVDGIGASDHIRRAEMSRKLSSLPHASAIIPFVRLSYAGPSKYQWIDDAGESHTILQGEGGQQGDPLMPLLFALGLHEALATVSAQLRPGEEICAFLDDVYAHCGPDRIQAVYGLIEQALREQAGIDVNLGKTKVWNKANARPPNVEALGDRAWCPGGIVILGSPVGTAGFMQSFAAERVEEEKFLLGQLGALPDLQCAWQLLTRSAVPRMHYLLRTLAPTQSRLYAEARDELVWSTAVGLLQGQALPRDRLDEGWTVASLPGRLGGLGVRGAQFSSGQAFWASWADAHDERKKPCTRRSPDARA
jgi:hypothetical protein